MPADFILVTGGAGFIGANFVLDWAALETDRVVVLDNFSYAGNLQNLSRLREGTDYHLARGDIGDWALVEKLLAQYQPRAVVHFAAESHVDRSIVDPGEFVQTNVVGTFNLLHATLAYWRGLDDTRRASFRFLQVSTDEVYGTLGPADPAFSETTPYAPNSPYAASKAAADHLVRAYFHTYGLPTLTTNCSNNYGPFQFPEKLIPLVILNALEGKPLPIYGDGLNVRDWLHVQDHCAAIRCVLQAGRLGETYNIGGNAERTNLQIVHEICATLDDLRPTPAPHAELITYVPDRPGHDRRYAIDARKIARELGWQPQVAAEAGLRRTVAWYLDNQAWVEGVRTGVYRAWIAQNYTARGTP